MQELAIQEKSRLQELEVVIERGLKDFYEVGSALLEIRDSCLYQETHGTFEEYCRERWDFTDRYARYLIASTETIKNLESGTMVPVNERQARPLTKIKDPEMQREAWEIIVETAPEGKITASHVAKTVKELTAPPEKPKPKPKPPTPKEKIVTLKFLEAYETFLDEIRNAKVMHWRDTSKEAALKYVEILRNVIIT